MTTLTTKHLKEIVKKAGVIAGVSFLLPHTFNVPAGQAAIQLTSSKPKETISPAVADVLERLRGEGIVQSQNDDFDEFFVETPNDSFGEDTFLEIGPEFGEMLPEPEPGPIPPQPPAPDDFSSIDQKTPPELNDAPSEKPSSTTQNSKGTTVSNSASISEVYKKHARPKL